MVPLAVVLMFGLGWVAMADHDVVGASLALTGANVRGALHKGEAGGLLWE